MGFNLMSVVMTEDRGAEVSFEGGMEIIKISYEVAACGMRKSGLYSLDMALPSDVAAVASLQLWHERLGHVYVAGVKWRIKKLDSDGLKCSSMAVEDVCETFVYGKAAMTPMPSVVPQSRGLPQKEGSNGRLSRSRDTRYGTRGPGSLADRNAKTSGHGLLAGDDGASHRRRPSS